jgi:hypothetical protein
VVLRRLDPGIGRADLGHRPVVEAHEQTFSQSIGS